ncbi:MAG: ABC transporter ATP-binding protein [Phycisphaerae bacterium]
MSAIVCENLKKRYDAGKKDAVDALVGLDLHIELGECFGLLGPNGAGKTTTIEILEGLLKPTSGRVEVLGMDWKHHGKKLRQRIGISLQETRLTGKLTAVETVRLFRSFYDKGRDPEEVLEMVSLAEKTDAWVQKLSGGQKQRLAVACALVGDPELLFLDEPTTGLDPQSRRELWDIVRDQRSRGRTTLITTHYMDEAERLCDRIAVVDHGKIIALGTPPQLIAQLGGEHVVEFTLENGQPAAGNVAPDQFADLPSVRDCRTEADAIALTVGEPHICIPALMQRLGDRGFELASLTTRHASLEDVFVNLTGRHLTDDDEEPVSP